MRRASIASALAIVLLGSLLNVAAPAYAAPADGVGLDVLNVNGSGCRQGTVAVALSPDNTAFTVTYSGYLAQVGVGAGRNDSLKDCRINVRVIPPEGYAYTVDKVDYRGFASLATGATAVEYATYFFNGSTRPPYRTYTFAGPFDDVWQTTDVASSPVYGACGATRVLSIDTQLQVQVGSSDPATTTSFITMDSTDGSVRTTYHLAWTLC
jgi:hypothetical protein